MKQGINFNVSIYVYLELETWRDLEKKLIAVVSEAVGKNLVSEGEPYGVQVNSVIVPEKILFKRESRVPAT